MHKQSVNKTEDLMEILRLISKKDKVLDLITSSNIGDAKNVLEEIIKSYFIRQTEAIIKIKRDFDDLEKNEAENKIDNKNIDTIMEHYDFKVISSENVNNTDIKLANEKTTIILYKRSGSNNNTCWYSYFIFPWQESRWEYGNKNIKKCAICAIEEIKGELGIEKDKGRLTSSSFANLDKEKKRKLFEVFKDDILQEKEKCIKYEKNRKAREILNKIILISEAGTDGVLKNVFEALSKSNDDSLLQIIYSMVDYDERKSIDETVKKIDEKYRIDRIDPLRNKARYRIEYAKFCGELHIELQKLLNKWIEQKPEYNVNVKAKSSSLLQIIYSMVDDVTQQNIDKLINKYGITRCSRGYVKNRVVNTRSYSEPQIELQKLLNKLIIQESRKKANLEEELQLQKDVKANLEELRLQKDVKANLEELRLQNEALLWKKHPSKYLLDPKNYNAQKYAKIALINGDVKLAHTALKMAIPERKKSYGLWSRFKNWIKRKARNAYKLSQLSPLRKENELSNDQMVKLVEQFGNDSKVVDAVKRKRGGFFGFGGKGLIDDKLLENALENNVKYRFCEALFKYLDCDVGIYSDEFYDKKKVLEEEIESVKQSLMKRNGNEIVDASAFKTFLKDALQNSKVKLKENISKEELKEKLQYLVNVRMNYASPIMTAVYEHLHCKKLKGTSATEIVLKVSSRDQKEGDDFNDFEKDFKVNQRQMKRKVSCSVGEVVPPKSEGMDYGEAPLSFSPSFLESKKETSSYKKTSSYDDKEPSKLTVSIPASPPLFGGGL